MHPTATTFKALPLRPLVGGTEPTGAPIWQESDRMENATTDGKDYYKSELKFTRRIVLAMFNRVIMYALIACFFASSASFLVTLVDGTNKCFDEMLSLIILAMGVMHYRKIKCVRGMKDERFIRKEEGLNSHETDALDEFVVDATRYADWFVSMPAVIYKLSLFFDRPSKGWIFKEDTDIAALVAFLGVLFGAIFRLGFDEASDLRVSNVGTRNFCGGIMGFVSAILSVLAFALVIPWLLSSMSFAVVNHELIRSVIFVWIAYPVVFLISAAVRIYPKETKPGYYERYIVWFKDLSIGLLDLYVKGVLCQYTATRIFGVKFLGA